MVKSSDTTNLNKIIELLDGKEIYKNIDEPLERLVNELSNKKATEDKEDNFHETMTILLKRLKFHGFMMNITIKGELDDFEIIWFLENYYTNHETRGYYGALYDYHTFGEEGKKTIIEIIIEQIKTKEGNIYQTFWQGIIISWIGLVRRG